MAQVSKNKLDPRLYEQIFALFPRILTKLVKEGKSTHTVEAFLTDTERIVVAKRVAIAFLLSKQYTYRTISSKLKVSTSTIIDVANLMKSQAEWLLPILDKMTLEDEFRQLLVTIGYNFEKMLPPKSGNWSTWRSTIEKEHHAKEKVL